MTRRRFVLLSTKTKNLISKLREHGRGWLIRLPLRAFVFLLAILGAAASQAAAPILPVCSWPFEVTGRGITNVATPDTNATYWVMPLDLSRWRTMVVHGRYPDARFFNFATYTATGSFVDTIFDEKIVPDLGSANPFSQAGPEIPGNYTVTIAAGILGSANSLSAGGSRVAFIVYRIYLPDKGLDKTGGAGLPAVTLTDFSGNSRSLKPCPFADAETSFGNLVVLLEAAGMTDAAKFLGQILRLANQSPLGTCNPNQPGPAAVTFSTAVPGMNFFPNPQTTYFQTANLCFQPNQILVIRGRAPVFPNTYLGGSVLQPAFDTRIQLRYWSMCNNLGVLPTPVVACAADAMTELDQYDFYTYIVSNDPAPPPWLPPGVTWLPWGPISFPITLIFRTILPESGFMAGQYVPVGTFCSQSQLTMQGVEGCFAAAGISVKMP